MKEIIMFYTKDCFNSITMMPILASMNHNEGKYKFIFADKESDEGMKIMEKFETAIEETSEEDSVPIFIDKKTKKAKYISNIEDLMKWLEGPDWWKKY
ncbi:MAG: hypothetical protein WC548_01585 [Candidatus Pacearchaeota archaeon]